MEVEAPVQIDFQVILDSYKQVDSPHPKDDFFKQLISSYTCFQEKQDTRYSKWNHGRKHHTSSHASNTHGPKRERPKIGNQDPSKENVFRKELMSVLNKLTMANLDTIIRQTRVIFQIEHMDFFVRILWEYFKRQPDFQPLYVQLLESIYQLLSDDDILEMNLLWSKLWNEYIQEEQWKMEYSLIEQSYNYDDFCEYLKEKKKKNAIAQAWGRLISLGVIRSEPFEWVLHILEHCYALDLENIVHKSMVDSYIEQVRDYHKVLSRCITEKMPSTFVYKIQEMKDLDLQKASHFKILDLLDQLEKIETNGSSRK